MIRNAIFSYLYFSVSLSPISSRFFFSFPQEFRRERILWHLSLWLQALISPPMEQNSNFALQYSASSSKCLTQVPGHSHLLHMCGKGKNRIPKLQNTREEGRKYKDQGIDGFQVYSLYCLKTILFFKKVSWTRQSKVRTMLSSLDTWLCSQGLGVTASLPSKWLCGNYDVCFHVVSFFLLRNYIWLYIISLFLGILPTFFSLHHSFPSISFTIMLLL